MCRHQAASRDSVLTESETSQILKTWQRSSLQLRQLWCSTDSTFSDANDFTPFWFLLRFAKTNEDPDDVFSMNVKSLKLDWTNCDQIYDFPQIAIRIAVCQLRRWLIRIPFGYNFDMFWPSSDLKSWQILFHCKSGPLQKPVLAEIFLIVLWKTLRHISVKATPLGQFWLLFAGRT